MSKSSHNKLNFTNSLYYDVMQVQNRKAHESNLRNVKGQIDNKPPRTFNMKITGGKKNYLMKSKLREEHNANVALMDKFDSIDGRHSPQVPQEPHQASQPQRSPRMHDFTEYELQQIFQTNRILADKLGTVTPAIKVKDNPENAEQLARQISKFKKKDQLVDTFTSRTIKLPVINRVDRSLDDPQRKYDQSSLEAIQEETKMSFSQPQASVRHYDEIQQIYLHNRNINKKLADTLDWSTVSKDYNNNKEENKMDKSRIEKDQSISQIIKEVNQIRGFVARDYQNMRQSRGKTEESRTQPDRANKDQSKNRTEQAIENNLNKERSESVNSYNKSNHEIDESINTRKKSYNERNDSRNSKSKSIHNNKENISSEVIKSHTNSRKASNHRTDLSEAKNSFQNNNSANVIKFNETTKAYSKDNIPNHPENEENNNIQTNDTTINQVSKQTKNDEIMDQKTVDNVITHEIHQDINQDGTNYMKNDEAEQNNELNKESESFNQISIGEEIIQPNNEQKDDIDEKIIEIKNNNDNRKESKENEIIEEKKENQYEMINKEKSEVLDLEFDVNKENENDENKNDDD